MNNKQVTFSDAEYAGRKKKGRRAEFLEKMERIIPWETVMGVIEPHYQPKKLGRPRCPLAVMLRMYLLQIWFNLADEAVEDAIYDSYAMKEFAGIDFGTEDVPDATTLLHFRHLLEKEQLQKAIFDKINEQNEAQRNDLAHRSARDGVCHPPPERKPCVMRSGGRTVSHLLTPLTLDHSTPHSNEIICLVPAKQQNF